MTRFRGGDGDCVSGDAVPAMTSYAERRRVWSAVTQTADSSLGRTMSKRESGLDWTGSTGGAMKESGVAHHAETIEIATYSLTTGLPPACAVWRANCWALLKRASLTVMRSTSCRRDTCPSWRLTRRPFGSCDAMDDDSRRLGPLCRGGAPQGRSRERSAQQAHQPDASNGSRSKLGRQHAQVMC